MVSILAMRHGNATKYYLILINNIITADWSIVFVCKQTRTLCCRLLLYSLDSNITPTPSHIEWYGQYRTVFVSVILLAIAKTHVADNNIHKHTRLKRANYHCVFVCVCVCWKEEMRMYACKERYASTQLAHAVSRILLYSSPTQVHCNSAVKFDNSKVCIFPTWQQQWLRNEMEKNQPNKTNQKREKKFQLQLNEEWLKDCFEIQSFLLFCCVYVYIMPVL